MNTTELAFTQFNLLPEIQQALAKMGFVTPSAIQAQSIPVVLDGKDMIGQAQTGSGKTAAFAIPTIHHVNPEHKTPQVLVLAPTRELAIQIADVYRDLLAFLPAIKVVSVYGGQGMDRQLMALQKQPQIIVATPGRLLDHVRRGSIRLFHTSLVVLDEADEMLKMGFRDDIENILSLTAKERQTVLFSATMPKQILQMAHNHQNNPVRVEIESPEQKHENIQQEFISVTQMAKPQALTDLLNSRDFESLLVFCNTKIEVDTVVQTLCREGRQAEGLHGGKPQYQRERILNRFRKGGTRILVATEVAARGIDVANIEAVLNYDFPEAADRYTHRIGRTGRAGKDGLAFSFVTSADQYLARLIQHGKINDRNSDQNFGKPRAKSRRGPGFRGASSGFGGGGGYRGKSARPAGSGYGPRQNANSPNPNAAQSSNQGASSERAPYGKPARSGGGSSEASAAAGNAYKPYRDAKEGSGTGQNRRPGASGAPYKGGFKSKPFGKGFSKGPNKAKKAAAASV